MTDSGGASWVGTVFKVNTDGTGFALVRSFAGGVADGQYPYGSLVVSGSTLYGMTYRGGASDCGNPCSRSTLCAGYALVRSFAGGVADGEFPYGSLVVSGSTLYGMTYSGGASNRGTVFKMGVPCGLNEYVSSNACVPCASGARALRETIRRARTPPAPQPSAPRTRACRTTPGVPCAPGSTRPAGDLATGADTACTATVCSANERVQGNACVACAPGSTRPAGDLATGPNTTCTATVCGVNERVESNACVACPGGATRPAGDLATGPNTACAATVCSVDEFVANNTCTAVAVPGSTRPAG